MTDHALKSSDDFCRSSEFGMENALAAICRRRWPSNPIDHIAREWGLTEGQARGVLYAQASRTTLNAVLRHRRGGLRLWLDIIAEVTGEKLEQYIINQAEEARREQAKYEAEVRRLDAMQARLSGRLGEDRRFDR
jgi:hypothetical protein